MYIPDDKTFAELFQTAFKAALKAGKRITELYESDDFNVSMKSDNSPLSTADREAHDIIKQHLIMSRIPVLSEEGRDLQFEERKSWDILWIVDPLDGTRQFIQKRGEFTVNIALITGGEPLFGIIYAPVFDELYFGIKETGAYKIEAAKNTVTCNLAFPQIMKLAKPLPTAAKNANDRYVILASYHHVNSETLEYIDEVRKQHPDAEVKKVGSSLKMCMLADGIGDVYARFTDTYEWDTAAGQSILEGAGWRISAFDTGEPLRYNKESLLNPYFICKKA
jgi:3'(2'), 5'-bisphosphate nucleotidase